MSERRRFLGRLEAAHLAALSWACLVKQTVLSYNRLVEIMQRELVSFPDNSARLVYSSSELAVGVDGCKVLPHSGPSIDPDLPTTP